MNKEEITNIDKIQDKYLTLNDGMDGMDSADYISDTVLYTRLLRILKKEELSTADRLFIIEILSKYKKYLEFFRLEWTSFKGGPFHAIASRI